MTIIKSFVERLRKIGVKVELVANYPWVYLDKVNGRKVWGKFEGNHGFTAFFVPVLSKYPVHITNISVVFEKIREMLTERVREYKVIRPADTEEFPEVELFYGTKEQCERWMDDYDEYGEYEMIKIYNENI